jgi:hypothetical protein
MIYLGRLEEGLAELKAAQRQQMNDAHQVIADAIQDQGDGYTVFSIVRWLLRLKFTEHL